MEFGAFLHTIRLKTGLCWTLMQFKYDVMRCGKGAKGLSTPIKPQNNATRVEHRWLTYIHTSLKHLVNVCPFCMRCSTRECLRFATRIRNKYWSIVITAMAGDPRRSCWIISFKLLLRHSKKLQSFDQIMMMPAGMFPMDVQLMSSVSVCVCVCGCGSTTSGR